MDASTTYTLQPGALLRLDSPVGLRLRVCAGSVWITESGCLDDHFVGAGEAHELTQHGLVLVGAEPVAGRDGPAVVRIEAARMAQPLGEACHSD